MAIFSLPKIRKKPPKTDSATQQTPTKQKVRKKFSKPHLPGRILVFENSAAGLKGAFVSCGVTSDVTIKATGFSPAIEPADAIEEILEQLKEQVKFKLPRKTVLITPSAAGELLYLPVDPKKKMLRAQMAEMVRWELEELFVEQNDIWNLGGLLTARGYLNSEQQKEIEERAAAEGVRISSNLYAEFVTDNELQECLAVQEQLQNLDEELVTGWSSHAGPDEMESFGWFGAGVGEAIRSRWVEACRKNSLSAAWIYPRLGCPAALIDEKDGWLLVDITQSQIATITGKGNRLSSFSRRLNLHGAVDQPAIISSIKDAAHGEIKTVYICAETAIGGELVVQLSQALNQRIQLLCNTVSGPESSKEKYPVEVFTAIARHCLGFVKPHVLPRIQAVPPGPPAWKNKELYPWVALAMMLLAIGGTETYMTDQTGKMDWELTLLQIEDKKRRELEKLAQQNATEMQKWQKKLTAKEKELKRQKKLRYVLDNIILKRQELVPGIVKTLGDSVNNMVILKKIQENRDRNGFTIDGWALKDTEGQLFINKLNDGLEKWDYKVADVQLNRQQNQQGMDGVALKIRLIKGKRKKEKSHGQ